jgi:hypothetical protein
MIRSSAVFAILVLAAICFWVDKDQTAEAAAGDRASDSSKSGTLFEELRAKDRELFDAVFKNCDLNVVKELVADDFEFLHDRGGLVATNGVQFVESIKGACERQKSGQEGRSRRELVEGSLEVFPLNNYGAIQTGIHRFYILKEGEAERPGDTARFTHVWRKVNGRWKITRVLSYDHKATDAH